MYLPVFAKLITPEKVSCPFMLAAIVSNALNFDFFSFCKAAYF